MKKRYISIVVVAYAAIEIGDDAITDSEALDFVRECIRSANDGNQIMRDALISHPVKIGHKRVYLSSELIEVGSSSSPVVVDSVRDLVDLSYK